MVGFVTVSAPDGYANALLNGSIGLVVSPGRGDPAIDTVLLLDGPCAGSEWQFSPDHLCQCPSGCDDDDE